MPKIKDTTNKNRRKSKSKSTKLKHYAMLDEEGNEIFDVEYVYGKKLDSKDQEVKYLVKWMGFSKAESTWEPLDHLIAVQATVKQYEMKQSRMLFNSKLLNKPINQEIFINLDDKEDNLLNIYKEEKENNEFFGKKEGIIEKNFLKGKEELKKNQKIIGDFRKHVPKKILKHKVGKFIHEEHMGNLSKVFYKVDWESDSNEKKPKSSYHSIEDLKLYCPLLLIEYFEKNAILIDNNKNFN